MEVDDDFEDTGITTSILTKKKKFSSSLALISTKEDSLNLFDNEKKSKKRKKKAKSKKKEKSKLELDNKKEEDNDELNTIGNLILNKRKCKEKENKENEKKVKFTKDKKRNIDNYIKKIFNNEKLSIFDKFSVFISVQILKKITRMFKIIYLYIKIRQYQNNSCSKISALYKAYLFRKQFKIDYLILKIINIRNNNAAKIIAHMKGFIIRKNIKKILEKKEDNYIIYSTLAKNRMLYFKIKYDNNFEDNIYFEFCKVLNCFVFYLSQKEKNLSKKKISGFFYNERYHKLTDDLYEKNQKGENVINFPKIIKKNNKNIDNYDKIINEFMKNNRYKKRKIYDLDEYEENKRKAMDDDMIQNKKSAFGNLDKITRSKSYMRLKGNVKKYKSILKPSKSYINLKSEERKIQFGQAKVKGYYLNKKYKS